MTPRVIVGALSATLATVVVVSPAAAEPQPASRPERDQAAALVGRWRDAQVRGDWPSYEALYAPTFTGVRRVGTKATTFNRAGWLKDRKAMFKAAMKVEATNLAVTADGVMLIVELDQYWEQGLYADVGRKRITIALTDGLIASEELLTSTPYLSVAACLKAMYPTGKRGRIGAAKTAAAISSTIVVPVGDRFACAVEHATRDATAKTIEVAGIRRAKGWVVADKVSHSVTVETGGTAGQGGHVELAELELGARAGLIVALTESEHDDMHRNERTVSALYLLDDASLTEVLRWDSTTAADVEDTRTTECTIGIAPGTKDGMANLERTCTKSWGDWWNEDESQRGIKTETDTARFVWDGSTYVEQ
jgi:hypothetical protein